MPSARGGVPLLAALVGAAGVVLTACGGPPPAATDLLRPGDGFVEGAVGGEPWTPTGEAMPFVRLGNVGYRALPGGPPGHLRFQVVLPSRPVLRLACGLAAGSRGGVEFIVKVRPEGRAAETAWSRRVDPEAQAGDAGWVPVEVDLAAWAGRSIELTLETHGSAPGGDPAGTALWGAPTIVGEADAAPLIVLYVVDTLRADHTGPYGHARDTTPVLDQFARDAVVFEQAIVPSSWTKPSMASMMTSLLPAEHGALRRLDPLAARHVTLAERLGEKGWGTGAVVTNAVLYARRSGFDQGFDHFVGVHGRKGRRSRQVRAGVAIDKALSWLDTRRGLPTFVWIHTMDPHFPYRPPAPFDRRFSPDEVPDLPPGGERVETEEERQGRRRRIARYDGEIAYGDREFGRFLRELEARGLSEEALVVFVSDHGEEFLDHGGQGHGLTLFDELVRVPLLVRFPGGRHGGRRVAQQVLGLDVMPTILQAAGVALPGGLGGRPLQGVLDGGEPRVAALVETQHWDATALGVRTETDKYIRRFSPGDDELYFDLLEDPAERFNRARESPEPVRSLRARIGAIMRPAPHRYVLRASGSSRFSLEVSSSGVLEDVEVTGPAPGGTHALAEGGQGLELELLPRPGAPREVSFRVRPAGAAVHLDGTRDGRPLRPGDLTTAVDRHPGTFPFRLPRPESENPPAEARKLFLPPEDEGDGLWLWLVETSPESSLDLDEDTLEALQALGYTGS